LGLQRLALIFLIFIFHNIKSLPVYTPTLSELLNLGYQRNPDDRSGRSFIKKKILGRVLVINIGDDGITRFMKMYFGNPQGGTEINSLEELKFHTKSSIPIFG
jgi:hypothetical protein